MSNTITNLATPYRRVECYLEARAHLRIIGGTAAVIALAYFSPSRGVSPQDGAPSAHASRWCPGTCGSPLSRRMASRRPDQRRLRRRRQNDKLATERTQYSELQTKLRKVSMDKAKSARLWARSTEHETRTLQNS